MKKKLSPLRNNYRKTVKITLILVYLVIAAGAVVRMTGSGMGCPDWPKCFGYYIPPTEQSQLEWAPDQEYQKGQVIIRGESLYVAQKDFISGDTYETSNWTVYDKHDYAVFNAFHTWTEFINRLLGALAGLATLVMALFSFGYWKDKKRVTYLSIFTVLAIGFQAWLGATVVYSVLAPVKITIHMIMALLIVAFLLYLLHLTRETAQSKKPDTVLKWLMALALLATVLQVVLGTQVRQFVDTQVALVGEHAKSLWLDDPSIQFYIHRSFSILVVVLNLSLAFRIYRKKLGYHKINWVLGLLLLEVATGIAMYYLDFPFGSQPIHLLFASFLFGVQFYLVLEVFRAPWKLNSL